MKIRYETRVIIILIIILLAILGISYIVGNSHDRSHYSFDEITSLEISETEVNSVLESIYNVLLNKSDNVTIPTNLLNDDKLRIIYLSVSNIQNKNIKK